MFLLWAVNHESGCNCNFCYNGLNWIWIAASQDKSRWIMNHGEGWFVHVWREPCQLWVKNLGICTKLSSIDDNSVCFDETQAQETSTDRLQVSKFITWKLSFYTANLTNIPTGQLTMYIEKLPCNKCDWFSALTQFWVQHRASPFPSTLLLSLSLLLVMLSTKTKLVQYVWVLWFHSL